MLIFHESQNPVQLLREWKSPNSSEKKHMKPSWEGSLKTALFPYAISKYLQLEIDGDINIRRRFRSSNTINNYSWSSRKWPPREFEKVVVTRAGRLQEYALVSDPVVKQ